jgi:hypothetical protein
MGILSIAALVVALASGDVFEQHETSSTAGSAATESVVDKGPPPAPPEAPKSQEEKAIEAQALSFNESMQRMQKELIDAAPETDFDALVAPYRLEAAALGDRMENFLRDHATASADEQARLEEQEQNAKAVQWVRGIPDLIALHVRKGLDKARAERTAPHGMEDGNVAPPAEASPEATGA